MLRAAIMALLLACTAQAAEPVHMKFGVQDDIAPFVMPDHHSGLLVDVIRDAMATQNIAADFAYLAPARMEGALRSGWIDVTTGAKPYMLMPGVLSRWPVTSFHNIAITLRKDIPHLDSVTDLGRYRVTAFRGAARMLGGAYQEAVRNNPDYHEPMVLQSPLLMLGQVDVVISQRDIFHYYLSRQSYLRGGENEVAYHDILGPANEYWFVFRNDVQRDAFERGVAALYASGAIDRIFERYQRQFGTSREFLKPLDCQFLTSKPKGC